MKRYVPAFGLLVTLALGPAAPQAHAWVGVRIGIGVPLYAGPGPYYAPYPYYAPTYVVPAPVVYQAAPPVNPAAPTVNNAASTPQTPSNVALPTVTQVTRSAPAQTDTLLRQLSDSSDTVRRDAALELGRLKAHAAVGAIANVLAKDPSPVARDGAARALGLLGDPQGLNALIYAAQADDDRDVRHSAQFAIEVIRSNMRNN